MNHLTLLFTTSLVVTLLIVALLIVASLATPALASRAGNMLERIDQDDDGKVSLEEFRAQEPGWIKHLDSNEDGAVSLEEITQQQAERAAKMREKMATRRENIQAAMEERFTATDTNQDGLVTSTELHLAAFNRLDEDEDGFLTKQELKQARHAYRRDAYKRDARKDGNKRSRHHHHHRKDKSDEGS